MIAQANSTDLSGASIDPQVTLLVPVDYTLAAERLVDAAVRLASTSALSIVLVGLLPARAPREEIDLDELRAALTAAELGFGSWDLSVEPLPGVEEQALITAIRHLRARAAQAGRNTGLRFVRGERLDQQLRALATSLANATVILVPSANASWGTLRELSDQLGADTSLNVLVTSEPLHERPWPDIPWRLLRGVRALWRGFAQRRETRV